MTEEELRSEKDRAAVAKMIGAKSAMEAALRRIAELENALKLVGFMHRDCMGAVGERACVESRFGRGGRPASSELVSVCKISAEVRELISKLTD